jgi:hypothetical protein
VTGDRLGGILALGAAQAALDAGLTRDRTGIASGTTSPVSAGGRLDFDESSTWFHRTARAGSAPELERPLRRAQDLFRGRRQGCDPDRQPPRRRPGLQ